MSESAFRDFDGFYLKFDENCSEADQHFFLQQYPWVDIVANKRNHCTTCDVHLEISPEKQIYTHSVLNVTQCEDCFKFYNSGEFEIGEDGFELYCKWCGGIQSGSVFCCSTCPCVFCKRCIRNNISSSFVTEIEKMDEWSCFVCDKEALRDNRAQHWALKNYISKQLENCLQSNGNKELYMRDASQCCIANKNPKNTSKSTKKTRKTRAKSVSKSPKVTPLKIRKTFLVKKIATGPCKPTRALPDHLTTKIIDDAIDVFLFTIERMTKLNAYKVSHSLSELEDLFVYIESLFNNKLKVFKEEHLKSDSEACTKIDAENLNPEGKNVSLEIPLRKESAKTATKGKFQGKRKTSSKRSLKEPLSVNKSSLEPSPTVAVNNIPPPPPMPTRTPMKTPEKQPKPLFPFKTPAPSTTNNDGFSLLMESIRKGVQLKRRQSSGIRRGKTFSDEPNNNASEILRKALSHRKEVFRGDSMSPSINNTTLNNSDWSE